MRIGEKVITELGRRLHRLLNGEFMSDEEDDDPVFSHPNRVRFVLICQQNNKFVSCSNLGSVEDLKRLLNHKLKFLDGITEEQIIYEDVDNDFPEPMGNA